MVLLKICVVGSGVFWFSCFLNLVLPADTDLNKVDVWFQDETRIGQQGSITRIWAEKGTY